MQRARDALLTLLDPEQAASDPPACIPLVLACWDDLATASISEQPIDDGEAYLLWGALAQVMALLAMRLLVMQPADPAAADVLLSRLGCTWRLADSLWASAHASEPIYPLPTTTAEPAVLDAAALLPSALLAALRQAFDEDSPFWTDHRYGEEGTPFFSYACDLRQPPANVVELAAHRLARAPALQPFLAGVTHLEWWAHMRGGRTGSWEATAHQLHFDCDERRLRKVRPFPPSLAMHLTDDLALHPSPGASHRWQLPWAAAGLQGLAAYRLRHPRYSSVLFLTPGQPEGAGPTVVLDQAPGQGQLAKRAWAVNPRHSRLMVFPGTLLHGVLPGSPAAAAHATPRTTLMLAWWDEAGEVGEAGEVLPAAPRPCLGPWMEYQVPGASEAQDTWRHLFEGLMRHVKQEDSGGNIAEAPCAAWTPAEIAPAWVPVREAPRSGGGTRLDQLPVEVQAAVAAGLPDLRLFIRYTDIFDQLYPV